MRIGLAGSLESNDCLISVCESDSLEIEIDSIVYDYFASQIRMVIIKTLEELKIKKLKVAINDKGALDYTIRSRLITAIKRMEAL